MPRPPFMIREIVEILRRSEVFLGLSDDQLEKIAALTSCAIKDYPAGSIFCKEGDVAETLAVVVDGRVNLTMQVPTDKGNIEEVRYRRQSRAERSACARQW